MNRIDPQRWAVLSPLLDDLLDLDGAARQARLAQVEAATPDLAAALRQLLAADGRARSQGFLTGAVRTLAEPEEAATLAGQVLGAYRLLAPLGQGGGGSVWRAQREDGRFDGEVAIKLLHLSLVGHAGAERFRREGQILARLSHPHIARLLDAGVSAGGQPYLVLELVQGQDILRHCDTHQLGLPQRLALFEAVLSAVAHAHTHGVIHRDLKPGNILVTGDGQVKLLDFGIAKLLEDEAAPAEATALTHEGGRALTPQYAAPEQLRGDGVTTATDVYALGVLLYQLLSGQHPTAAPHASAAEVMRATLDTEPARLSRCVTVAEPATAARRGSSSEALRRHLAGDLETIVAHALRKPAAERYRTVTAFADDLRRYREHEPVLARPDAWSYRTRKFARRHRGGVLAGAVIALAITAGLVGTVWQAGLARQASLQARAERDRALEELNIARAAQELLSFMVSDGSGKAVTTSELLDRTQASVERGFASQPLARARLLLMLGAQRGELMQIDQGRAALELARTAAAQAGQPALQASIDCLLGHMHTLKGELEPARALIDTALRQLPAGAAGSQAARADCLNFRVLLQTISGSAEQAVADAREALRLEAAAGVGRDAQTIQLRAALAAALRMQGQRAEAIVQFKTALSELEAIGRGQTARAATLWNNLGAALAASGQVKAAADALRTSVALHIAVTGQDRDPVALANLAGNLAQMERFDEALPLLQKALGQAVAEQNPRVEGEIGWRLASALIGAGQADAAALALGESRRRLGQILKPQHPSMAMLDIQTARLALLQGQPATALAPLRRAQQVLGAIDVDHPGRFQVRMETARASLALGDLAAARSETQQAWVQAQHFSSGFDASAYLGEARLLQAQLAAAEGHTAQAADLARQAERQFQTCMDDAAPLVARSHALAARWSAKP